MYHIYISHYELSKDAIFRPHGQGIGCLLWGCGENRSRVYVIALYLYGGDCLHFAFLLIEGNDHFTLLDQYNRGYVLEPHWGMVATIGTAPTHMDVNQ